MADSCGKSKPKSNKKRQNKKPSLTNKKPEAQENGNGAEIDTEAQFERELSWCIQQLTISLSTNQQKYTHKQAQTAIDALRSLNNPKSSFIKKRQVMRVNFGDYRKKMAEEEKKYYANMKKPCVESKSSSDQKCKFLKKATACEGNKDIQLKTSAVESGQGFKFNFAVNEQGGGDSGSKQENTGETCSARVDLGEGDKSLQTKPAINYYKMPVSSDSDFKFNFDIS